VDKQRAAARTLALQQQESAQERALAVCHDLKKIRRARASRCHVTAHTRRAVLPV